VSKKSERACPERIAAMVHEEALINGVVERKKMLLYAGTLIRFVTLRIKPARQKRGGKKGWRGKPGPPGTC